jgi:uncharacterized protein YciI
MKDSTSQAAGLLAASLRTISLVSLAVLVSPLLAAAATQLAAPQPAAAQATALQPTAFKPAAGQTGASQPAAAQAGASQADGAPNMTTYYVALLRRGPQWTATLTPEISKALDGHMANIRRLAAEGKLLLAGPFLEQSGPGTLAGLFVLEAGSMDEAKQLVATDPAVQAGRFVPEVVPWLGPKSLQTLNPAAGKR